MTEQKQIEEMRSDLIEIFDEEYEKRRLITPQNTAEKLAAKGYRKQPEWISVEEMLPDKNGDYLVFTKNKDIKVMPFFSERNASSAIYGRGFCEWVRGRRTNDDDWWEPVCYVTHWMPLPTPPKGDEGK